MEPDMELIDDEDIPKRGRCQPHWGWMVVFASFVSIFLCLGVNYSSGLYYVQWMEHFGASSAATSWIGSLQIGVLCFPGPLGSYLGGRFGDRKIIIISGVISSAGLVASAYVNNIYALMVTYGAVTGFGFCLMFSNVGTAAMNFFSPESAGLAIGIAVSGGGCGAFIMPVIMEYLIVQYGWEGSLLILGGLMLNICVCGALIRTPPMPALLNRKNNTKKKLNFKILKNSNLTLFLLHQILFTTAVSIVYIHITAMIESLTGVSRSKSSLVLTVIGVTNFLGRIIHGAIGGLKSVNVMSQYLTSYAICGCALLIFPHVPYYPVLMVIGGIIGFLTAPYAVLVQLILVEYAGMENLKFAYGMFLLNCGIGLTVGAPIAGVLYDVTKNYGTSMYFGGASLIACVLMMLKPWVQATCIREKYYPEINLGEHNTPEVEKQLVIEHNGSVT